MKTRLELVKWDVAERCSNTFPATNHPLNEQGVAVNQSSEQWRPVIGFEGIYEVSDQGRFRSLDRYVEQLTAGGTRYRRFIPGRLMNPTIGSHGYPYVSLRRDGRSVPKLVHRILLEAFVGPCPDGMEACHANDIKTDNRLVNLRWDTSKANKSDMLRNGGHFQASQTHCKNGHEFTPENTAARGSGRRCLACKRISASSEQAREKARERNRRYEAKRRAS